MYHKAVLSVCYTPRSSSPGSSSSLPCGKDGWFSLLSCTTIYVYVILSKNASLSRSRGLSLVCGCKGTHFPRHGQNKKHFFCKKKCFFVQHGNALACALYIMVYKENMNSTGKVHPAYRGMQFSGRILSTILSKEMAITEIQHGNGGSERKKLVTLHTETNIA